MANSIAAVRNYTTILDEVYQCAAVSRCLNSLRRMVRAGRNHQGVISPTSPGYTTHPHQAP